MNITRGRIAAAVLCMILSACSTPRGAGFEAEVLAASERTPTGEAVYDFDVHAVTRETLPQLNGWADTSTRR